MSASPTPYVEVNLQIDEWNLVIQFYGILLYARIK